jgi:uncharacterized membrane protein
MDIIVSEWASLCLRWLHVVAGIAWIGSSFYFMHLDYSLRPNAGLPKEAYGEAWQVHGGGFYHMIKFLVAPPRMPEHLTWFKWEAYTTWLSGIALLVAVYYLKADLFLIDRAVLDIPAGEAVGISVACLIAGWFIYDGLCRSPVGRNTNLLLTIGFVFLVATCYGFTHVFSGRGTFLQMGAMIGTMMIANVWLVIIPNQKKVIAALIAGEKPDPALGEQGKLRSVHNNYLTLPVVLVMIGNHYPLMFATRYNWLIFAIVLIVGAVIRHFYNVRHAGGGNPWWTWAVAAIGMVLIVLLSGAGERITVGSATTPQAVTLAEVHDIVSSRCAMCHAAEPVWEGFARAPKDLMLDTPEHVASAARLIMVNAVLTNAMPPGNVTEISPEERRTLGLGLQQNGLLR